MPNFARNLCYRLWKLGIKRVDWPGMVAGWVRCDLWRAEKLLIDGNPSDQEINLLVDRLEIDAETLCYGDLFGEDKNINVLKENLTRLFENLKHGQKQVIAEQLKVNSFTLSRWLAGEQKPKRSRIAQIKKIFSVSDTLDLTSYPLFLSFQPEGIAEKRGLIRHKLESIDDDTFNELYAALLKILG